MYVKQQFVRISKLKIIIVFQVVEFGFDLIYDTVFSLIVKSRSNLFLEPTGTKQ